MIIPLLTSTIRVSFAEYNSRRWLMMKISWNCEWPFKQAFQPETQTRVIRQVIPRASKLGKWSRQELLLSFVCLICLLWSCFFTATRESMWSLIIISHFLYYRFISLHFYELFSRTGAGMTLERECETDTRFIFYSLIDSPKTDSSIFPAIYCHIFVISIPFLRLCKLFFTIWCLFDLAAGGWLLLAHFAPSGAPLKV